MFFISTSGVPLVNRIDLQPTRTSLVLDPLAVLGLENRQYILRSYALLVDSSRQFLNHVFASNFSVLNKPLFPETVF